MLLDKKTVPKEGAANFEILMPRNSRLETRNYARPTTL